MALLLSAGLLVGCSSTTEPEATIVPDLSKENEATVVEEAQGESTAEPSIEAETEESSKETAQEDTDSLSGNFDVEAALVNVSKILESARDSGIVECTGNTFAAEAMDVGFGQEVFTSCQTDFGMLVINEYPSDSHAAAASDNYIDVVAGLDYSERINLAVMNDERTYIYVWGDALAQLDVPALANHLGFDYEQILTGLLE
jgi:hypothetical protein